jgi:hypothetical protein
MLLKVILGELIIVPSLGHFLRRHICYCSIRVEAKPKDKNEPSYEEINSATNLVPGFLERYRSKDDI